MINYKNLEKYQKNDFINASPFEHVVIDNFCDEIKLSKSLEYLENPENSGVNRSRDFIFAKNKFEKSDFNLICDEYHELKADLMSDKFKNFLKKITGENIFIDPDFHGGGLHQGGKDSFLDMHVDFNYHPHNHNWFRNINILIYLNKNWKKNYGGELKIRDGRKMNSQYHLIEPLFNRAVIMFTRDYTYHGYDRISFPDGKFRRSIAAYGYTIKKHDEKVRTTVWYPENKSTMKKFIGKHMPKLVKLKSFIFGSGTTKNK